MDRVELASRLSVFDSFLFLAPNGEDQPDGSAIETNALQSEEKTYAVSGRKSAADTNPARAFANASKEEGPSASQTPIVHEQCKFQRLPMVESNVRRIPGSDEEWQEMSDKLSSFDKYMFLLDTSRTSETPSKSQHIPFKKRIAEEVTLMTTKIPKKQMGAAAKQEPQKKT